MGPMDIQRLLSPRSSSPCRSVCEIGAAEVILVKQVLGLCLKLRLVVSGDCPASTRSASG